MTTLRHNLRRYSMAAPARLVNLILAGLLFILAACETPTVTSSPPRESEPDEAVLLAVEPQSKPIPQDATPTAVRPVFDLVATPGDEIPTVAPDPLRFIFPSPPPAPVSAWRPPLYPTPWAPTPYDHFFFTRPIGANDVNWPLADYRYGGIFMSDAVHTGIDIPTKVGTPVLAAGPGKVTWAGYGLYALDESDENDPYGLAVAIKHEFGYEGSTLFTVYGHMDRIHVTRGQTVSGGELIGEVGETGLTSGPHLHFEVRVGKNNFFGSRNPELWLSPPQGWGVLAARVMDTNGSLLYSTLIRIRNLDTKQYWEVKTYGQGSTNPDPYYRENMVIGDLPEGKYFIWLDFDGTIYNTILNIHPGRVSYFLFRGKKGFTGDAPPDSVPVFTPPPTMIVAPPETTALPPP